MWGSYLQTPRFSTGEFWTVTLGYILFQPLRDSNRGRRRDCKSNNISWGDVQINRQSCSEMPFTVTLKTTFKQTSPSKPHSGVEDYIQHYTKYYKPLCVVPSSEEALPPSTAAGSKEVPLTVKTLTLSLHLTVLSAFPVNEKREKRCWKWQEILLITAKYIV